MKKLLNKIMNKRFLRQVACTALSVSVFFVYSFFDPFQANAENVGWYTPYSDTGYEWHLCYSKSMLEETIVKAQRACSGKTGVTWSQLNRDINDDSDWTRFMLVWEKNGAYRYTATSGPNTDEYWTCGTVLSSYGIKPGEETFTTRTGLNTPYLKRSNQDQWYDDNNDISYGIRMCTTNSEALSDTLIGLFLNFYGVSYHAATYAEFQLNGKVNDYRNGREDCSFWVSNRSTEMTQRFRFSPCYKDYYSNTSLTLQQVNTLVAVYTYYEMWYSYSSYGGGYYSVDDFDDAYSIKKVLSGNNKASSRTSYASEDYTDTSKYDLSVLTNVYKTKDYPNGISGVDAYQILFKEQTKAYVEAQSKTGDGTVWLYYDFDGWICQRYWETRGDNQLEISSNVSPVGFMLYIGIPYTTPKYTGKTTLEDGITKLFDNEEVCNGATVTVNRNSTLIVKGHSFNNGTLYVDGGTVIVKGVLDSDVNQPFNIVCTNGGTLIIEEEGTVINRSSSANITLSNNSTLYVSGVLVTAQLVVSGNSTIRGGSGSLIALGAGANDSIDITTYSTSTLYSNRGKKFSDILKTFDDVSSELSISKTSSFTSDGCVFINSGKYSISSDTNNYMGVWVETDKERTISDGMVNW